LLLRLLSKAHTLRVKTVVAALQTEAVAAAVVKNYNFSLSLSYRIKEHRAVPQLKRNPNESSLQQINS